MLECRALIVAVNPMPRLYLEDLVRSLAPTRDVTVLTFYRETLLDQELTNRVAGAGASVRQQSFGSRVDYVRQLRAAARWMRGWLRLGGEMHVFHCQPNHLLTNYLTFAAREQLGYQVHLIPDGMANHYTVRLDPYRRDMRRKHLIGPLLGLPYTIYEGDYLARDSAGYTSYWYVGSAGVMADHLPCQAFEVQGRPPVSLPDRWLFLGQPAANEVVRSEVDALLRKVRERFGCLGDYKPHPAESLTKGRRDLLDELGVEIVGSEISGESLAAQYGDVIGIGSSVLINIRMLGWGNRAHSVMDPARLSMFTGRTSREMQQVVQAMTHMGVFALREA